MSWIWTLSAKLVKWTKSCVQFQFHGSWNVDLCTLQLTTERFEEIFVNLKLYTRFCITFPREHPREKHVHRSRDDSTHWWSRTLIHATTLNFDTGMIRTDTRQIIVIFITYSACNPTVIFAVSGNITITCQAFAAPLPTPSGLTLLRKFDRRPRPVHWYREQINYLVMTTVAV